MYSLVQGGLQHAMRRPTSSPTRRGRGVVPRSSNNLKLAIGASLLCLAVFSLFPILILERLDHDTASSLSSGLHLSPEQLLRQSNPLHMAKTFFGNANNQNSNGRSSIHKNPPPPPPQSSSEHKQDSRPVSRHNRNTTDRSGVKLPASVHDLPDDVPLTTLGRGLAGRPMDQTPALQGAKRGKIANCEINVDNLAYWNDPQGQRDQDFVSPFSYKTTTTSGTTDPDEKFISFSPDPGGWNNIRMSMEIIFVLAAATGRTLVLPPKEPLYLLHHHKKGQARHRGFADFYPLQTAAFQSRVKTISMEDFLQQQIDNPNSDLAIPPTLDQEALVKAADHCDHRKASSESCAPIYEYLEQVGNVQSNISSTSTCMIFDETKYQTDSPPSEEIQEYIHMICGKSRKVVYFTQQMQQPKLIHYDAAHKDTRLLAHFYSMIHFTNPKIDNYYKRFVRDFLHYHDSIFCAAGKIIKAVQAEGAQRGFLPDANGAGGFSAMHIRRGDLQYKRVKIPAIEWYENTKEIWNENEILYIATDERNKTFFDDLSEHYELRFLDDYWDFAGLSELDGNYMGMIDTIVASRGRAFAGTWFSTFSGFIVRMRGYHGLTMKDTWYSFLPKKTALHEWEVVDEPRYAFEWPDGWIGIDADEWPSRDVF